MKQINMKQIEADVVIVLESEIVLMGEVIPFWECEDTQEQLVEKAVNLALRCSENMGGGSTKFFIHDFRTSEK